MRGRYIIRCPYERSDLCVLSAVFIWLQQLSRARICIVSSGKLFDAKANKQFSHVVVIRVSIWPCFFVRSDFVIRTFTKSYIFLLASPGPSEWTRFDSRSLFFQVQNISHHPPFQYEYVSHPIQNTCKVRKTATSISYWKPRVEEIANPY